VDSLDMHVYDIFNTTSYPNVFSINISFIFVTFDIIIDRMHVFPR